MNRSLVNDDGGFMIYMCVNMKYLLKYIYIFHRVPELFTYLAKNSPEDIFYEDDIWPGEEENGYVVHIFGRLGNKIIFLILQRQSA